MLLFPEFSFQILNRLHYFVQLWISNVMGITGAYDNPPEVRSVGYFLVHVFFKLLKFIGKAYDCSGS